MSNEKSLPDQFHSLTTISIEAKGVYPHHVLSMKDGKLTMASLMLGDPHEAYAAVMSLMLKDKPDELIFGLDRFCKPGQGTTLGDCVAGAYFIGGCVSPFVIEYQHEPRVVKPIDWHNEWWNRAIARELAQLRMVRT